MSTTVEVMADAFKEAGTPFIVGHPGGESVELIEAANQRDMRFILMKQETAGAMLAATWGRAQRTWSTELLTPISIGRR
jgi:acetolactate synthase I/II/III large subunit